MAEIVIREAEEEDFDRIVELNGAVVEWTSAMDVERLRELARLSCFHRVALMDGHVAAFLLAMREDAPYPNDNHAWFAARFPRFVYVDRVVVGSDFAGLSIGSLLYRALFGYARSQGVGVALICGATGTCRFVGASCCGGCADSTRDERQGHQ